MEVSLERAAPHCLYTSEAVTPEPLPPLAADTRVACAIVGGGYTGLATALHLAERQINVALLEARDIGWGAAGRNGGQVNAGLKPEPEQMCRDLGPVYGPRLAKFALSAPDRLFELVERLGIDCSTERHGTLRVATSDRYASVVEQSTRQWTRYGAKVQFWSAERVGKEMGTNRYRAGMFDASGGALNPLALVRGLADTARRAGAAVYPRSPALSIGRDGKSWRIRTPAAEIQADRVLIATQAYTDNLWPGLRTSMVPVFSSIVATEPLPRDIADKVVPGKQVVYEVGNITTYFRRDHSDRLLIGGRGIQRLANDLIGYRHLIAYARRLWPELAGARWTHWWNGQLAISTSGYPGFHCLGPGLFAILGYARGICFGTMVGAELATVLAAESPESFVLPLTDIPKIPLHRFWKTGVRIGVMSGRLRDAFGF